ncbi:hypothetical protein [Thermoplasma sp.]|uniref:hypothetical protein n=1 Tax=Thermoplasma sp. TaxID=1973142 RepID=UPI0012761CB5|nr:hypothetical protein [Thermoplasma sp.]KAA8923171.1 MAG: hypothetical protein F6Q11_01430 [Thermoplasma sp.]
MFRKPEYAYIYRGVSAMVAFTILTDLFQALIHTYLTFTAINFIALYLNTFALGILFALLITYGFLEGSRSVEASAILLLAYFVLDYTRSLIPLNADPYSRAIYGLILLILPILSRTLALFYYRNVLTRFLTTLFFIIGSASALLAYHGLIYVHHPMRHAEELLLILYLIVAFISSVTIYHYSKRQVLLYEKQVARY